MEAYIKGMGIISPQKTGKDDGFLTDIIEYDSEFMKSIEPKFKDYLNPALTRRLSKIIKLSLVAAKISLDEALIEKPDAIITGTGLGCVEDSEKFLLSIIENNEKLLPPTAFIQSTHNAVASHIAVYLNCNGYNMNFVHRIFSLENALINSLIYLDENTDSSVLLGTYDEITKLDFDIKNNSIYKKIINSNLKLLEQSGKGAIAGEGTGFFVLNSKYSDGCYCKIRLVKTIYNPESNDDLQKKIKSSFTEADISLDEIDTVMLGFNSDYEGDSVYYNLIQNIFMEKRILYYKHLCGEYYTSASFAMWCCAKILKSQNIPSILKFSEFENSPIKNILIYNQFRNQSHSLIVLSKC